MHDLSESSVIFLKVNYTHQVIYIYTLMLTVPKARLIKVTSGDIARFEQLRYSNAPVPVIYS